MTGLKVQLGCLDKVVDKTRGQHRDTKDEAYVCLLEVGGPNFALSGVGLHVGQKQLFGPCYKG